jgi:predicted peptidase
MKFRIDTTRAYLTGLSLGGMGTWRYIGAYPNRFRAAVPVCGGAPDTIGCSASGTPVWAFHGEKDNLVPLEDTKKAIAAHEKCGGTSKLTVYPEVGHNSWERAYDDPELYEWLFDQ